MHRTQKRPGPISVRWKGPRDWWDTQSDPSLSLSLSLSLVLSFSLSTHPLNIHQHTLHFQQPVVFLSLCTSVSRGWNRDKKTAKQFSTLFSDAPPNQMSNNARHTAFPWIFQTMYSTVTGRWCSDAFPNDENVVLVRVANYDAHVQRNIGNESGKNGAKIFVGVRFWILNDVVGSLE